MKLYRSLLLLAFALLANNASASNDYICKIDRVVIGPANETKQQDAMTARFKGKEFSVSRTTGVMSGALKNAYITAPVIVDSGSKDNSFKVVTTLRPGEGMGPGSYVYLLVIREYQSGPAKPFMFADNDEVYFGNCRSF